MAQTSAHTAARRALLAMVLITVALVGLLTGAHQWGDARWTPKLGLDLEGGTQMILEPRLTGASTVSAEQIDQARDIIVQRVDAGGISGAEVTTQGGRNIVVSIPGTPTESTLNAIRRSSQMQFRPVLAIADGVLAPTPTDSASPTVDPSASPAPSTTEAPVVSPAPEASPTAQSAIPGALVDTPTPAATDSASPVATPSPSPSASASGSNSSAPDPTSLEWVTPELQTLFAALNCADPGAAANRSPMHARNSNRICANAAWWPTCRCPMKSTARSHSS